MLIDMHCHTFPRSQCSALHPEAFVRLARLRGLDGVCLTEHDAFWPEEELAELSARTGFLVLRGVEFTTDLGHVLAYGLSSGSSRFASASSLFAAAQEEGALLFLAHPARDGHLRVTRETVEFFESVESLNGSDTRLQNMAAAGLARGFRLPGIGGSDSHSAAETARAATSFAATVTDTASLVAALRSGTYMAVPLP
ncbi:MAG: PHP domain-containing protein [Tepidiformaceae bacterium]